MDLRSSNPCCSRVNVYECNDKNHKTQKRIDKLVPLSLLSHDTVEQNVNLKWNGIIQNVPLAGCVAYGFFELLNLWDVKLAWLSHLCSHSPPLEESLQGRSAVTYLLSRPDFHLPNRCILSGKKAVCVCRDMSCTSVNYENNKGNYSHTTYGCENLRFVGAAWMLFAY